MDCEKLSIICWIEIVTTIQSNDPAFNNSFVKNKPIKCFVFIITHYCFSVRAY